MFPVGCLPSSIISFSAFAEWAREINTLVLKLTPQELRSKILTSATYIGIYSPELTLVLAENSGQGLNKLFEAAELYLSTKITSSSSVNRLRVHLGPKDKTLSLCIEGDQKIVDTFEEITQLKWKSIYLDEQNKSDPIRGRNSFELRFRKEHMNRVTKNYLSYVLERSEAIKEEKKVVRLHPNQHRGEGWRSINLNHPVTFDTIAMDPDKKRELKEDLDMLVKRREYYRRVGKAWKRGYLLYGPPGTGKSSLVAAMANCLNFNIYDLELSIVRSNTDLGNLLVGISNRSIIVIEDIDCSVELHNRADGTQKSRQGVNQLTLSGLMNVIDGLWSSLGDERIIVFTNYKDRLDPALLRPGRMDVHIHMSYCTPDGFKLLASNYLEVQDHQLFEEIEGLMKDVNVTPAEVAEELMKKDDPDIALQGLLNFLKRKASECFKSDVKATSGEAQSSQGIDDDDDQGPRMPKAAQSARFFEKKSSLFNHKDQRRISREIEGLMKDTEVTPANLVEEMVKSKDAEIAVNGIVDFLNRKKTERQDESDPEAGEEKVVEGAMPFMRVCF